MKGYVFGSFNARGPWKRLEDIFEVEKLDKYLTLLRETRKLTKQEQNDEVHGRLSEDSKAFKMYRDLDNLSNELDLNVVFELNYVPEDQIDSWFEDRELQLSMDETIKAYALTKQKAMELYLEIEAE